MLDPDVVLSSSPRVLFLEVDLELARLIESVCEVSNTRIESEGVDWGGGMTGKDPIRRGCILQESLEDAGLGVFSGFMSSLGSLSIWEAAASSEDALID